MWAGKKFGGSHSSRGQPNIREQSATTFWLGFLIKTKNGCALVPGIAVHLTPNHFPIRSLRVPRNGAYMGNLWGNTKRHCKDVLHLCPWKLIVALLKTKNGCALVPGMDVHLTPNHFPIRSLRLPRNGAYMGDFWGNKKTLCQHDLHLCPWKLIVSFLKTNAQERNQICPVTEQNGMSYSWKKIGTFFNFFNMQANVFLTSRSVFNLNRSFKIQILPSITWKQCCQHFNIFSAIQKRVRVVPSDKLWLFMHIKNQSKLRNGANLVIRWWTLHGNNLIAESLQCIFVLKVAYSTSTKCVSALWYPRVRSACSKTVWIVIVNLRWLRNGANLGISWVK